MSDQRAAWARFSPRFDFEGGFAFVVVAILLLTAETLILFRYGDIGLLVHTLTVITLILFVYQFEDPVALLFQSLILVPILRIFNLGIPTFTDNSLVFLGIIYLFILMSTWQIVRSQDLSLNDLGLTVSDARRFVPGMVIGAGFGLIQFFFSLEPLQYEPNIKNYVLVILVTGLLVGFVEEVIFRGLIQRWAGEVFGQWPAIIGVSVLFGFMHSVWLAPMDIVFAGTVSIFLGWIYATSRNMWFITGIHAMINITAFLIAPLYMSYGN